jgi:hypothetical protein
VRIPENDLVSPPTPVNISIRLPPFRGLCGAASLTSLSRVTALTSCVFDGMLSCRVVSYRGLLRMVTFGSASSFMLWPSTVLLSIAVSAHSCSGRVLYCHLSRAVVNAHVELLNPNFPPCAAGMQPGSGVAVAAAGRVCSVQEVLRVRLSENAGFLVMFDLMFDFLFFSSALDFLTIFFFSFFAPFASMTL